MVPYIPLILAQKMYRYRMLFDLYYQEGSKNLKISDSVINLSDMYDMQSKSFDKSHKVQLRWNHSFQEPQQHYKELCKYHQQKIPLYEIKIEGHLYTLLSSKNQRIELFYLKATFTLLRIKELY